MCPDEKLATEAVKNGRTELRALIQMAMKDCEKPCKIRNYKFSPLITNDIDENTTNSYFYVGLVRTKGHLISERNFGVFKSQESKLKVFLTYSLKCVK